MINDTQQENGLVALMAILGGQGGGWTLMEKGGELYVMPPAGRQAARKFSRRSIRTARRPR